MVLVFYYYNCNKGNIVFTTIIYNLDYNKTSLSLSMTVCNLE